MQFRAIATVVYPAPNGEPMDADLILYANGSEYNEPHPYGSTVAYEKIREIDEVTDYLLDDEPVTLQYLHDRFGKDYIDNLIEDALDDAEVNDID